MNAKLLFPVTGATTTVLAAALFANVIACAGLHADRAVAADDATVALSAAPPGLIDDHGGVRLSLPEAVPVDPGARTRAGRYALLEQAKALDFERRGDVVWLDVACCGVDAADTYVDIARGLRAAAEVSSDAPVLVMGRDLRLAAFVADRLEEQGERRVFLITR